MKKCFLSYPCPIVKLQTWVKNPGCRNIFFTPECVLLCSYIAYLLRLLIRDTSLPGGPPSVVHCQVNSLVFPQWNFHLLKFPTISSWLIDLIVSSYLHQGYQRYSHIYQDEEKKRKARSKRYEARCCGTLIS